MWMGGPIPLGYDVVARKLTPNEAEADVVRHIFRRYAALGSVRLLEAELNRTNYRTKLQIWSNGRRRGGGPWSRGPLYHLLGNRLYRGEIGHRGTFYEGEHDAIVSLALDASATLRTVLLRYVQTFIVQTAQSAVSNAHQRIEARLARWLLMCHDRSDGDEIGLTHEFMGMMIAAERSGVTVSLHVLEGSGMIRSRRGWVTILDRNKLEELAGDGYGKPEAEYRKLIAPFGKDAPRLGLC